MDLDRGQLVRLDAKLLLQTWKTLRGRVAYRVGAKPSYQCPPERVTEADEAGLVSYLLSRALGFRVPPTYGALVEWALANAEGQVCDPVEAFRSRGVFLVGRARRGTAKSYVGLAVDCVLMDCTMGKGSAQRCVENTFVYITLDFAVPLPRALAPPRPRSERYAVSPEKLTPAVRALAGL